MINKPINPTPYNSCIDASQPVEFQCEISNNTKIDGYYTTVNNMENGEVVDEIYQSLDNPVSKITFTSQDKLENNKEYTWQSLYWQNPNKDADNMRTVTGINNNKNRVRIMPSGNPSSQITPNYVININCPFDKCYDNTGEFIEATTNGTLYNSAIFTLDCGHELTDDTSGYCSTGVLNDYFGYPFFLTGVKFLNAIRNVGLGKCVINVYKENILIGRARCLAYDRFLDGSGYLVIIDNFTFEESIATGCDNKTIKVSRRHTEYECSESYYCYPYDKAEFYDIDAFKKNESIQGFVCKNPQNCIIKSCKYLEKTGEYEIETYPNIAKDTAIGDVIGMWSHNNAEYNESPTYYFRTKSTPETSINIDALETIDGVKTLKDVKCEVGVTYNSPHSKINYFYLYLYVLNPKTNTWELMERSPMLNSVGDKYEFVGFVDGYAYKVCGVYTDQDGDEWESEDVNFSVSNPAISIYNLSTSFNSKTTTIDVSLEEILRVYKNASLEFYKVLKSDINKPMKLRYAGGGLCKTGGEYGTPNDKHHIYDGSIISFDRWCDYNIKNDSYYDYYVRVSYTGRNYDLKNSVVNQDSHYNLIGYDENQGFDFLLVATDVHTEFEGTSILGLEKISQTQLGITSNFNLFYNIDNKDIGELTNEISREYINSFNEYPKELKGHQNYFTGRCSGLLGSECKGVYEEPKGIRDAWKSFVNDDTIKLYRGIDGETMIISIDSSRVKPFYFPGAGLVNEVYITFKEIASTEPYAIFGTQKDR